MLYQLSYFRIFASAAATVLTGRTRLFGAAAETLLRGGQRWIRTTEGVRQQIYSLPHLATLVFAPVPLRGKFKN